jgi:hypothetical protein
MKKEAMLGKPTQQRTEMPPANNKLETEILNLTADMKPNSANNLMNLEVDPSAVESFNEICPKEHLEINLGEIMQPTPSHRNCEIINVYF